MKTISIIFTLATLFSSFANADQLCGKLNGYCLNGADSCIKTITPTYSRDGVAVTVVADDQMALNQLNQLLAKGKGTRVCAAGTKDESGIYHVSSAHVIVTRFFMTLSSQMVLDLLKTLLQREFVQS